MTIACVINLEEIRGFFLLCVGIKSKKIPRVQSHAVFLESNPKLAKYMEKVQTQT